MDRVSRQRTKELVRDAHEYKIRVADLDADVFNFDRLYDENLKLKVPKQVLLGNVSQDNITDETLNGTDEENQYVDEDQIFQDIEDVNVRYNKNVPIKRYIDIDDFLKNGIDGSITSFYDFGELSKSAIARVKEETGVDLNGYVHTLQNHGIIHGENKHSAGNEKVDGQIPITREDWKLADKIVNEFDEVVKSPRKNVTNNEILIFKKQIGNKIYYVAEVRTGRKKLVSATMYKHRAKKEGDLTNRNVHLKPPATSETALVPSPNSQQSQNVSENQEENLSDVKKSFLGSGRTIRDIEAFDENNPDYKKQYEEVVAKYKGTPLWLKAPNGKPTKLTERQWVQVRTPNFKKWFGDWEKEAWAKQAMDFLENTETVASITGNEFQKDNVKLTDKVSEYFKSIGGIAHNEELGDVVLDLKGVEDSLGHGMGRLKASAFMAVKDVIEKGFIFNREKNWKNRGWDTAVITAPIKIGNEDYICEVVVKKVNNSQRFYLHEVETKKTLDNVFKSVANNGNASQVSKLILGKHLAEVKGKVSKVVDENGEPLVVYHGSDNSFTVFDSTKTRSTMDIQGNFFSPWEEDAMGYGTNVRAFFLNIKNPANENTSYSILKKYRGENYAGITARKELIAKGYDGVNNENEEFIAFNSTQIKSATDNVGSFDRGMRFSKTGGTAESNAQGSRRATRPLFFKPILTPDLGLPRAFEDGKTPSLSSIRRWVSEALGINVTIGSDLGKDVNGYYTLNSDTINLANAHINDLKVLFHEIGHALELRFWGNQFSDFKNTAIANELIKFYRKNYSGDGYSPSEYPGEGFAEFIKDFILKPDEVKKMHLKLFQVHFLRFDYATRSTNNCGGFGRRGARR